VFWNPPEKYEFKNPRPKMPESLRIYEAHIGMVNIRFMKITFYENRVQKKKRFHHIENLQIQ
jgi:hypothetical protein